VAGGVMKNLGDLPGFNMGGETIWRPVYECEWHCEDPQDKCNEHPKPLSLPNTNNSRGNNNGSYIVKDINSCWCEWELKGWELK
jgi:hypothetical protein